MNTISMLTIVPLQCITALGFCMFMASEDSLVSHCCIWSLYYTLWVTPNSYVYTYYSICGIGSCQSDGRV